MKMSTSSLPCTKCHRMHRTPSIRSPTSYMKRVTSPDITSFNDGITASSTPSSSNRFQHKTVNEESTPRRVPSFDDDIAGYLVGDGEATLRRKRKGRSRHVNGISPMRHEIITPSRLTSLHNDYQTSLSSRDSGILSVVFDDVHLQDWDSRVSLPKRNMKTSSGFYDGTHHNDTSTYSSPEANPFCKPSGSDDGIPVTKFPFQNSIPMAKLPLPTPRVTGKCLCVKRRLVQVLYEWVLHFPADFRNKKIMWTLNNIMKSCQAENEVSNSISYSIN